jgi:hypothetical protein
MATTFRIIENDSLAGFRSLFDPASDCGKIWATEWNGAAAPIEVAQPVIAPEVAVESPVEVKIPEVEAPAAPVKGQKIPKGALLRPNGEVYYPRTIKVGALETTDVEFIRTARANAMNVFLKSAPGTGKTAAIETAFTSFEKMVVTASTEESDFVGSWVQVGSGVYEWKDGPLVRAMENGIPLFVDEIALGDPRELSALYSAMDGSGSIKITANPARGSITVREGFVVVAATNPNVPGALMSEALVSRFDMVAEWLTDFSVAKKLGCNPGLITVAKAFQKRIDNGTGWWTLSMRGLIKARNTAAIWDMQAAVDVLVGKAPEEVREDLIAMIKDACGVEAAPTGMVIR